METFRKDFHGEPRGSIQYLGKVMIFVENVSIHGIYH